MSESIDLAVIGAGPAGLSAATEAASHGLSVVLFDEQPTPGGQIYRNIENVDRTRFGGMLGEDYMKGAAVAEAFRASATEFRPGVTVWRVDADGSLAWTNGDVARITNAKRIVAATGALERAVPIPGWTLPGVMSAGGAQILLKTAGLVPDGPTIVAGNGPLLYLVANQLFNAGAQIVAVLETTRFRDYIAAAPYAFGALKANEYLTKGSQMIQNLKRKGLRVQPATSNIYAAGNDKFEKVCFTANREYQEIEAKTLLLHQGVVPNVQITRQVGAMHEWYEPQRYWRPVIDEWGATTVKTLAVAGDGVGIFGAEVAEATGRLAGLDAAHRLGKIDELERDVRAGPLLRERNRIAGVRPLLDRLFRPTEDILRPTDDTLVCRCEEVTAGAIRECVADGATGPNQLKAYTRCGMGLCQGRICGLTVAEIIADASKKPIEDIGYYRLRPPLKPVTLGELAAMED